MWTRSVTAVIGALLLAGLARASAGTPVVAADLDDADRRRVERGEVVRHTQRVEGFAWPEVTVWRRVAATPAEVMAFYEYKVPGPNETYTVAVTVRRTRHGFEARWTLVRARYARRLSGEIDVEPFRNVTLVRYPSRVDPGVLGALLGDPDSVGHRLRATINALAAWVERLRIAPAELDRLARALVAMVGGDS